NNTVPPSDRLQVLSAAASGNSPAVDLSGAEHVTVYVRANAGVTAGVVAFTTADDADETVAWGLEGQVARTAAGMNPISMTGAPQVGRVEITTPIVGGTVDVWVSASGNW